MADVQTNFCKFVLLLHTACLWWGLALLLVYQAVAELLRLPNITVPKMNVQKAYVDGLDLKIPCMLVCNVTTLRITLERVCVSRCCRLSFTSKSEWIEEGE